MLHLAHVTSFSTQYDLSKWYLTQQEHSYNINEQMYRQHWDIFMETYPYAMKNIKWFQLCLEELKKQVEKRWDSLLPILEDEKAEQTFQKLFMEVNASVRRSTNAMQMANSLPPLPSHKQKNNMQSNRNPTLRIGSYSQGGNAEQQQVMRQQLIKSKFS